MFKNEIEKNCNIFHFVFLQHRVEEDQWKKAA